jgi:subtilisin
LSGFIFLLSPKRSTSMAKTNKKKKPPVLRFVLLPTRGLQARQPNSSLSVRSTLLFLNDRLQNPTAVSPAGMDLPLAGLRVLDSIHEDGAKLVEMDADTASALHASHPGLRIVPVVYYYPAVVRRQSIAATTKATVKAAGNIAVQVVSASGGAPVAGATVVAFTDFASKAGAQGTTNASGQVSLALGAASKKIERLYVYAKDAFWNLLKQNFTLTNGAQFALRPIDLSYVDELRYVYPNISLTAGTGVSVGVVDTGIAPHPDLTIAGGRNTVLGENASDYGDNGEGHGTHVGGIIAAHGTPPTGIRGMAPAVRLFSYRVFGQGQPGASNYAIAKGIDAAVQNQCDLINMSLGGGSTDDATQAAIAEARNSGSVVIVAAGNDNRQPVSFPASDPMSIAISALGRKGTYPPDTVEVGDVMAPFASTDANYYITSFSNVGPEIALTGPGDGIISTFPGGYAVMDGTSMATPAVTGVAARLLATRSDLLQMPRDASRSDAIAKFLLQSAKALGLGVTFEGRGLPS